MFLLFHQPRTRFTFHLHHSAQWLHLYYCILLWLIVLTLKVQGLIHNNVFINHHLGLAGKISIRRTYVSPLARLQSFHDHQICLIRPKKCRILTATDLSSTPTEATHIGSAKSSKIHQCKFCAAKFSSRNSLFRHIMTCSQRPREDLSAKEDSRWNASKKISLGFRFSYAHNHAHSVGTQSTSETEAQISGRLIQEALRRAICLRQEASNVNTSFQLLTNTQGSVAKQRHKSLTQEGGCAAANDVMTISFLSHSQWFGNENNLRILMDEMNAILEKDVTDVFTRVLEVVFLNSSKFHAEKSCTQYIYHYVLPLKWLRDGEQLEQWWLSSESNDFGDGILGNIENSSESPRLHPGTFQTNPPSESLKVLRNTLKDVESITLPNRRVRRRSLQVKNVAMKRQIEKVGKRKIGTIINKERRAFHNFADPCLQGDASPNQEPVWRILDRCRIAEIKKNPVNDKVVAVLEFRGDAFLPQQIRRIIGTAVGVTNGWLPQNTIDIATRPDIAMITALAPPGRLYLQDLRFHFDESNVDFCSRNINDKNTRVVVSESTNWLQQRIFAHSSKKETEEIETKWLSDFQENTALNIRNQIRQVVEYYRPENECQLLLDEAPATYSRVLHLLQQISTSGWPETSAARAKVIKNAAVKFQDKENQQNEFGSFTIVNPKLFQPTAMQSFPVGNQLFPELVRSVFELEEGLSKQTLQFAGGGRVEEPGARKPSTHCAVNFNASFTPHVDSGTGLGQSLSMIVGLGDYKGGEIFVEGDAYPIRYQPLEFDGWKQRHWTGTYTGERFSLVWFTPQK